ncbi:MAG: EXLDI protein [Acidimicrobiales bacterium]
MPNKTIYVSEEDLPVYERAQELAGGNLSAAVARGLHRFVKEEESHRGGFREVTVSLGAGRQTRLQRFSGEVLGTWRHPSRDRMVEIFRVYRTPKEHFVLHLRRVPDWLAWAELSADWPDRGGSPDLSWRRWNRRLREELTDEVTGELTGELTDDPTEHATEDRGPMKEHLERAREACWPGPCASTLDVADSLTDLKDKVPPEFFETLLAAAEHPTVEVLDI